MAPLTTVHSEYLLTEFRAPFFSTANLWRLLKWPMITVLTLLLAFVTQGLWRRTNTYLEQPTVEFNEKFIVVFEDANSRRTHFWAQLDDDAMISSANLLDNNNNNNNGSSSNWIIESGHWDSNGDLQPDEITIHIGSPQSMRETTTATNASSPPQEEQSMFTSIFYAIFFDVRLGRRASIQIKSMPLFGQIHAFSGFNELSVMGDLEFLQSALLPSYGDFVWNEWDRALHQQQQQQMNSNNNNNTAAESHDDGDGGMRQLLLELQRKQMDQNFSISLGRKMKYWNNNNNRPPPSSATAAAVGMSSSTRNNNIALNFTFKIHEQILHYRTDALEMLKWAWIQYLAMFIIVRALFNALSSFLYQNQILSAIPVASRAGEKIE